MTPTNEQLDKLERLEKAAKPPPWAWPAWLDATDCELIASLRNAAPSLIAEIRRLRASLHEIGHHVHNTYPANSDSYKVGIADGHRCAARVARLALGEEVAA